jgi:hypothetical protein
MTAHRAGDAPSRRNEPFEDRDSEEPPVSPTDAAAPTETDVGVDDADNSSVMTPTDQSNAGAEPGYINPSSGLANDYLNVFNEILLVLEMLPDMGEMAEEVAAWQPRTYCEYLAASSLPGAKGALDAYRHIDPMLKSSFEAVCSRLLDIGGKAQAKIAEATSDADFPASVASYCEQTAEIMRIGLSYATRLINDGASVVKESRNAAAFKRSR